MGWLVVSAVAASVWGAVLVAMTAFAAGAEQMRPDPVYFTGVYERVGRTASDPPGLIDDLVRIAPTAEGWGLLMSSCGTGMQPDGWPVEMRPGDHDEVPNIIGEDEGPFRFWCQYFNDHSNYPVLTCQTDMGALFTLWPITDERMAACMKAAGQEPLP